MKERYNKGTGNQIQDETNAEIKEIDLERGDFAQSIIGDKYRLIKKLGEGGGGRVYLAEDLHLGTVWAVKEVRERELFEREAETLRTISHKNLPLLIDIIRQEEKAYLVMEYIEGRTLKQVLEKRKTLSLEETLKIGIEILEALKCLHHQKPAVIYGDLKPSNIMLEKEGGIKLIDFGTGFFHGTIGYAAPEQVLENLYDSGIDGRTDIYCFGILFYKMITGEFPRDEDGMKKIKHPYFGDELRRILAKCMAFEKGKRYEKVELLIEDLKKLSGKEKRKKRRKKVANGMFLFLFICSTVCFVLYSLKWNILLYPAALFWLLAFLWYKAFCGKKDAFYQGDGIRLFLTQKKIPGLFLFILWISSMIMTWNILLFSKHMEVKAANAQEAVLRDEFGRKVLIKE